MPLETRLSFRKMMVPKMMVSVGRRDRWMFFVFGIFVCSLLLTFHYFWETLPAMPKPSSIIESYKDHDVPPPPNEPPYDPGEHSFDSTEELVPTLPEPEPEPEPVPELPNKSKMVKPEGVKVSGLIFYGRKDRVSCMRCYLERNLVENGGWLDEVLWIVNTENEEDLDYLNEIVASNPRRFRAVVVPGERLWVYTYWKAWRYLERGKYYIKIDDDIMWIDDDAIPKMVTRKMEYPNDLVVSANIINNPPLGFMHYHMGAIHPYFPELERPANASHSWRPSHQPYWQGPEDYWWPLDRDPPSQNHRWLRVQDDTVLPDTPASELTYDVWGDSYSSWAIATQMHYSLLENIEKNQLDLYKFNKPWDMDGERIRINFMCVYGDDIVDSDVENWPKDRGDEDMLVLELPRQMRRPVVIIGDALGAHFQYSDQGKLGETDLLARYQALADEEYCIHRG